MYNTKDFIKLKEMLQIVIDKSKKGNLMKFHWYFNCCCFSFGKRFRYL